MKPAQRILNVALPLTLWIALVSSTAAAEHWACGVHFESQCSESGCSAYGDRDDGNTKPVFAQFDESGNFQICMYTGCFEGQGKVLTTKPFLSITKEGVSWTGTDGEDTDVFIVLERKENIGMFKAASFVQPIICTIVAGKD